MRNQNGVSMIEVVISVILLLFIAFFSIYSARNAVPTAEMAEVYSEMCSVEQAIEAVKTEMIMDNEFELKKDEHYDEISGSDYIIYGSLNHEVKAAKALGISNLKRDYVVNYTTGDFELKDDVSINGTKVKTLESVQSMIDSGNV